MARGTRQYARTRGIPKSTIHEAIAAGHIPLNADGSVNFAATDLVWLPGYRPVVSPDVHADPEIQAQQDAELRRTLIELCCMPQQEADAVLTDLDRLLADEPAVRPASQTLSD